MPPRRVYDCLPFSLKLRGMGIMPYIYKGLSLILYGVMMTWLALPQKAWAQSTVLYSSDFEGGASGWSNNTTTNNAATTRFLGRFDNNPTTTSRTFTVPSGTTRVEIEFDFYKFDSWDNNSQYGFDRFQIEVDGTQLFSLPFFTTQVARSGVTGNVSWDHSPLGPASQIAFGSGASWYQDQFHRVTLVIDAPGPTLSLLLRTAINQGGNDESGGYDNMTVTAFLPEPDVNITKTVAPAVAGTYMLPGNDVRYSFNLTSNGAGIDSGTLVLADVLPPEISLFTGDLNGSGQPVDFSDNSTPASGLTCCAAANIEFSDTTSGPAVFGYVPTTPYDDAVTHIRITPSGGLRDASADPIDVEFGIRARIK